MPSQITKPERPKDGREAARETAPRDTAPRDTAPRDTAMVEVVPNGFGVVLPGGDWWVNEPVWDQAVRRLTAPPQPTAAAVPHQQPQKQPPRGGVAKAIAEYAAAHEDLERN